MKMAAEGKGKKKGDRPEERKQPDLRLDLRLMLGRTRAVFGPGIAEFLSLIDERGSMLAACKEMGMSYSKGWKKMNQVEAEIGFPFLERRAGGADGGNSRLTERGREFLHAYLQMEREVERSARESFARLFQEEGDGDDGPGE